jgi:hypothetical protein
LDAGLFGVLLLMLGYGISARAFYDYTLLHVDSVVARLLFALLIPALMAGVRDDVVDTVARLAFLLIPIAATFGVASLVATSRAASTRRTLRP